MTQFALTQAAGAYIRGAGVIMNRFVAASIALVAFATSGTASAQARYYMRERIAALSTAPAYGAWSSGSWSAKTCVGSTGSQTRTVSCSTSSCDPSTKPAETQSAGSCSYSCDALASGKYNSTGKSTVDLGNQSTLSAANSACQAYALSAKVDGGCNWNNLTYSGEYKRLRFWVGSPKTLGNFGDPEFYGSLCSWK